MSSREDQTKEMRSKSGNQLREALLAQARDGRLPCARARQLAERLNIPYREVGKLADELGIKITQCELGCF